MYACRLLTRIKRSLYVILALHGFAPHYTRDQS